MALIAREVGCTTVKWFTNPTDRTRPDLRVYLPTGQEHIVELSGCEPTCATYLRESSRMPRATLHAREDAKVEKYREKLAARHVAYWPFVWETYGALGDPAVDFVRLLSPFASSDPREQWCFNRRSIRRLSVVLQRSNARMLHAGYVEAFEVAHGRVIPPN